MKITEIIAHPLSVALAQPRWTAHELMDRAQMVLVEVRTDQGIVGFGEISGGPQTVICDLVKMFARVVQGMDPLGHTEVWTKLFALTSPRPGGLGGWDGMPAPLPRNQRPQIMAAIGGIDIALWDIKGKAAGLPVFRILGGTRTEVFTYATGGYYLEGELLGAAAEELAGFVAAGYRAVKLKCGALSLRDEVARIRAVRQAIGPDVLLMLDMNAPYDVAGCIKFAVAVAPYDIFWLEEPLHWYLQPADFRLLGRGVAHSAGARRAGVAPLHRARLHRLRRDPLCAVRFHAACGVHRIAADRTLCRTEGRVDRTAFGGAFAWASGVGVRRRGVRRGVAWRSGTPPAAPRNLPRWGRGQEWHGVLVGGAGIRDGNRLEGRREIPGLMCLARSFAADRPVPGAGFAGRCSGSQRLTVESRREITKSTAEGSHLLVSWPAKAGHPRLSLVPRR